MAKMFPREARLNRVLGVLRILNSHEGKLNLAILAKRSHIHAGELHPQIEAARMLGLARLDREDVLLTPLGRRLQGNDNSAVAEVLKKLKSYEPFRTAGRKIEKTFSVEELAMLLTKKAIYWHTNEMENKEVLKDMLIQWAIFFKLASYNGDSQRWSKANHHTSPA